MAKQSGPWNKDKDLSITFRRLRYNVPTLVRRIHSFVFWEISRTPNFFFEIIWLLTIMFKFEWTFLYKSLDWVILPHEAKLHSPYCYLSLLSSLPFDSWTWLGEFDPFQKIASWLNWEKRIYFIIVTQLKQIDFWCLKLGNLAEMKLQIWAFGSISNPR